MSNNPLGLNRDQLSKALGGNHAVILAFEQLQTNAATLPSTIEEANALAGSALSIAQAAVVSLSLIAEALTALEYAPVPVSYVGHDDTTPRPHLGTASSQNADSIEITGGTIDGTPIGSTVASSGRFTSLAASGQITSTVATGTPPLVIASTDLVANLYVARANEANHATSANTASSLGGGSSYPANATDLPTVIALANALKAANQSKGV